MCLLLLIIHIPPKTKPMFRPLINHNLILNLQLFPQLLRLLGHLDREYPVSGRNSYTHRHDWRHNVSGDSSQRRMACEYSIDKRCIGEGFLTEEESVSTSPAESCDADFLGRFV